jgi:hypothetical protein
MVFRCQRRLAFFCILVFFLHWGQLHRELAPRRDQVSSKFGGSADLLCLGDFDDEVKTLLGLFFQFIEDEMATRRHFQVFQAYLKRFLKLYEQLVVANEDLLARVESLCAERQRQWDHLQQLLHNNLYLVQYFSKIRMKTNENSIEGSWSWKRDREKTLVWS